MTEAPARRRTVGAEALEATGTSGRREPTPEQLQAAVDLVVSRLNPDQVILFGSAVHGEMNADSDIDLLVLRPRRADQPEYEQDQWKCDGWDGHVDVVIMDREHAEQGRRRAGDVRQPALGEGRTLYARAGTEAVRTGPIRTWRNGVRTRTDTYDPDEYTTLLKQAGNKMHTALTHPDAGERRQGLAACLELTLKATLVARGRSVRKTHKLNEMWKRAESAGAEFPVERDGEGLQQLQQYAGGFRYHPPSETVSKSNYDRFLPVTRALYDHAVKQCPKVAAETRERIAREGPPAPADYKVGTGQSRPCAASSSSGSDTGSTGTASRKRA